VAARGELGFQKKKKKDILDLVCRFGLGIRGSNQTGFRSIKVFLIDFIIIFLVFR
jgi:hypothetical protein